MGGEVFLRPAWANAPKEYKKGGKVKKAKKPKTAGVSQKVNVNVKIGDTVLLRKGNAPRRGNPGVATRLLTQGSAFGGGLPRPLQSITYASAPQVAMPLSRMDFIGASDALFNLNRDRRNDIQVEVNPSGIRADASPSKRAIQNTKPISSPDSGLAASRNAVERFDRLMTPFRAAQAKFQGDTPRINDLNLNPSVRAAPAQPSTGFLSTKASMIGSSSSSASASASASNEELDEMYGTSGGRRLGRDQGEVLNRGPPIFSTPAIASRLSSQYHPESLLYGQPKNRRAGPENYQQLSSRGGSAF